MLLKLVWILIMFGKNTTRKMLKMAFLNVQIIFEIFWGSMPPEKLASSALCNCLGYQKSLATALVMLIEDKLL